jgi:hypothetical protein
VHRHPGQALELIRVQLGHDRFGLGVPEGLVGFDQRTFLRRDFDIHRTLVGGPERHVIRSAATLVRKDSSHHAHRWKKSTYRFINSAGLFLALTILLRLAQHLLLFNAPLLLLPLVALQPVGN